MRDQFDRKIDYMRLSITDRCNLRCRYCMPAEVPWTSSEEVLTSREILKVCEAATFLGIRKFKITGGEPLVRKDCIPILGMLKAQKKVEEVTITTNGILLGEHLKKLKEFEIDGVNISLDTLKTERYREITGRDGLDAVKKAIYEGISQGLKIKVNSVIIKGVNEDEILDLAVLARDYPLDVRFIEMMPLGYGKHFSGMSANEVRRVLQMAYPCLIVTEERRGNGPAVYGRIPGFQGCIGFIDAIHGKFCQSCNRVRLTADGWLKLCLYHEKGRDLKACLRQGGDRKELIHLMEEAIYQKPLEHHFEGGGKEKGAETRQMSQIGG